MKWHKLLHNAHISLSKKGSLKFSGNQPSNDGPSFSPLDKYDMKMEWTRTYSTNSHES